MNTVNRGNKFMFYLLFIFVVGSLTFGLILNMLSIQVPDYAHILVPQIGFISIPIVIYFLITKEPVRKTLRLNKLDGVNILIAFGIGLFIQPLLSFINLVSQLFAVNFISGTIISIMSYPFPILILLIAVLPSINEEIVTRGILLANYKNVSILTTSIVSGAFFGMLHLNINQFSYAFIMGIILCLMVEITDSILASMIIHFTINGTQITFQKLIFMFQDIIMNLTETEQATLMPESVSRADILALMPLSLLLTCFTTPIAILIFYSAIKYNKKHHIFKNKIPTREPVVTRYFVASVILFLSFIFVFEILL